jgi:hypothetical protein
VLNEVCDLHHPLIFFVPSVSVPVGHEDERKGIWTQSGCDEGEEMPAFARILLLYWPNYSSCIVLVVNYENKYCFYYFQIGSKTVKQCIQFYYLWKKVCPDEYKRLRLIRRRQNADYGSRTDVDYEDIKMDDSHIPVII